jgi:hypothetical protein
MITNMWEEHPEYQKAQAKMIGIGLALLFLVEAGFCISQHDWDSLRQVCLIAGAILLSLVLLSGAGRLLVRIFVRKRNDKHDS